ncbi:MAG: hypothetical protein IT423_05080, partial [Pirellulaceae bacterium]|nr:hypothetical protein [Pirellulaceae bacterium]
MPWFDPPVPYDLPWPTKLQVFGMPGMAIGMSSPFVMAPAIDVSLTLVQPGSPVGRRIPAGGATAGFDPAARRRRAGG